MDWDDGRDFERGFRCYAAIKDSALTERSHVKIHIIHCVSHGQYLKSNREKAQRCVHMGL
jgi:hypothetical protein